jgi:hypothetical protein
MTAMRLLPLLIAWSGGLGWSCLAATPVPSASTPAPAGPPPVDTAVLAGDLAFREHTGGHAITAEDRQASLELADRYLRPGP